MLKVYEALSVTQIPLFDFDNVLSLPLFLEQISIILPNGHSASYNALAFALPDDKMMVMTASQMLS